MLATSCSRPFLRRRRRRRPRPRPRRDPSRRLVYLTLNLTSFARPPPPSRVSPRAAPRTSASSGTWSVLRVASTDDGRCFSRAGARRDARARGETLEASRRRPQGDAARRRGRRRARRAVRAGERALLSSGGRDGPRRKGQGGAERGRGARRARERARERAPRRRKSTRRGGARDIVEHELVASY